MKFKITYNVWKTPFTYETESVSDAFTAVKAILQREKIMYPDQEKAFCDYFEVLSHIAFNGGIKHETHLFSIEKIQND